MKRLLLTSALCAIALPAVAGSLTISITSTPITGSKSFTISDADATKFMAWAQSAYPTRPNPAYDPLCVSACAPATLPNNAAQALGAWADGVAAGTTANVQNYHQGLAVDTAKAGVGPISIK